MARVLVVGGTGMLADATRWLASQDHDVTLLARNPETLATEIGATAVRFEWTAGALPRKLEAGFELALICLHDDGVHHTRGLEDSLLPEGRVVRVHGSLSDDPVKLAEREPNPRPGLHRQHVILGYHPDPSQEDGKRWLTHSEIADGTIAALAHPAAQRIQIGVRAGR